MTAARTAGAPMVCKLRHVVSIQSDIRLMFMYLWHYFDSWALGIPGRKMFGLVTQNFTSFSACLIVVYSVFCVAS